MLKMDELVSAKQFLPDRSRSGDFGIIAFPWNMLQ
jgi:hypothetical protein